MDAIADFGKKHAVEVVRQEEEWTRAELDLTDAIDESLVLTGSKRRCFEQAKVCRLNSFDVSTHHACAMGALL